MYVYMLSFIIIYITRVNIISGDVYWAMYVDVCIGYVLGVCYIYYVLGYIIFPAIMFVVFILLLNYL